MSITEKERIKLFNKGEIYDQNILIFRVSTLSALEKLNSIKEVVLAISDYDSESWLADKEWERVLPMWFLKKIKSHSLEEITKKSTLLWDYGSWLDAMKYRGWEWYSSKITYDGFEIILKPVSFPFTVNPLEYVIWETGVNLKSIEFIDQAS